MAKDGYNESEHRQKRGFLRKFFAQFADLMIIILLVASVLSFGMALYTGEKADLLEPVIIIIIVLANAVLGTVQEYRAERSLETLKQLTSPKTRVCRDGNVNVIDSRLLVVGDIVMFEAGDVVTADCELLLAEGLFVNQSALTGESAPVEKTCRQVLQGKRFRQNIRRKLGNQGTLLRPRFRDGNQYGIGQDSRYARQLSKQSYSLAAKA